MMQRYYVRFYFAVQVIGVSSAVQLVVEYFALDSDTFQTATHLIGTSFKKYGISRELSFLLVL